MIEKNPEEVDQDSSRTLTDDQIVTERKTPRRSFLAVAGTFVAGAAAIVAGTRARNLFASPQDDPDKKKTSDPDKKKKNTKAKTKTKTTKASDPDKNKT
jgi:hypothetical protein